MSVVFAQMYQFSLNLSSLQQKFSLTSNYLVTNTVVVKRVDFIRPVIRNRGPKIWKFLFTCPGTSIKKVNTILILQSFSDIERLLLHFHIDQILDYPLTC